MDLSEHLLEVISSNSSLNILGEVLLVVLVIIFLHLRHVVSDVFTHDASLVNRGIVGLGVAGVSGEALVVVGDIKSSIGGTLEGSEHTGSSRSVLNTNIQKSAERAALLIDLINEVRALSDLGGHNLTSGLLNTRVDLIHAQLLQQTTSNKKTSAVSSGVVLETDAEAISGELLGAGSGKDLVTIDLSIDDLANHISVSEADNQAVLRGLVLVLILGDELVALVIVSLALASSAELDLVALEISLILNNLNERLQKQALDIRNKH